MSQGLKPDDKRVLVTPMWEPEMWVWGSKNCLDSGAWLLRSPFSTRATCPPPRCAEHLSGATCDEGRPLEELREQLPWAQGAGTDHSCEAPEAVGTQLLKHERPSAPNSQDFRKEKVMRRSFMPFDSLRMTFMFIPKTRMSFRLEGLFRAAGGVVEGGKA